MTDKHSITNKNPHPFSCCEALEGVRAQFWPFGFFSCHKFKNIRFMPHFKGLLQIESDFKIQKYIFIHRKNPANAQIFKVAHIPLTAVLSYTKSLKKCLKFAKFRLLL